MESVNIKHQRRRRMLRMGKRIAKWKKTKATKLDKNTEKGFEDVRDGKSSIQWLNTGNHLSLSNDNMTFPMKKKKGKPNCRRRKIRQESGVRINTFTPDDVPTNCSGACCIPICQRDGMEWKKEKKKETIPRTKRVFFVRSILWFNYNVIA